MRAPALSVRVISRRRPNSGFTLTELLIVVGIISILIGLIFPALSRAREAARRTQCASNLRQITIALIAYTGDNRGWFPAPAAGFGELPHDWVRWRDPQDFSKSAIAKWVTPDLLVCPSDVHHRYNWFFGPTGTPPYPFSYTVNVCVFGDPSDPVRTPAMKITRFARRSSDTILVVEESELTINDGMWVGMRHTPTYDLLATRHDIRRPEAPPTLTLNIGDGSNAALKNPRLRGNASFVDGHVAYLSRQQAYDSVAQDPR